MSKFKVGDKAKVRKNLKYGERYAFGVNAPMAEMAGQTVTISKACGDFYHIEEEKNCHFCWTDEMFEPAPVYASDLMTEARNNKEKYEGKQYKVINKGHGLWANGSNSIIARYDKCIIKNGFLTAGHLDYNLSCDQYTQLEEIKPEPKPVPFMEAVKAYNEGKKIICESPVYGKEVYDPFIGGNVLKSHGGIIRVDEILDGTWYIEE